LSPSKPRPSPHKVSGLAIASLALGIINLLGVIFLRIVLWLFFGISGIYHWGWLAIVGMVGNVFSGFFGILGLILGILAIVQITKSQGKIKGKGMAIAGIVLAVFILILSFIAFILYIIGLLG